MTLSTRVRFAIVLLGLAAYAPAVHTGFLYDDHILIEANPVVRHLSLAGLRQDVVSGIFNPTDSGTPFYRPVQVFSTQLEYALWKLNPLPYHVTNLALHLGNILLVYELLLALGFEMLVAGLAASLFAVHPIIVEDLLMVSGRGELLGLFFMLLSLVLCLRNTRRGLWLGLGAFFLALLSKESAAVTPVLLALALFYKKEPRSAYRAVIAMIIPLGLYLALRQHAVGLGGPPSAAATTIRFLFTAFPTVLLRYAKILVLPFDLHTDRLLSPIGPLWVLKSSLVLLLGGWIFMKGPRWAWFSGWWYALSFLPKVPLMISGSFMSDHWAYPALLALALVTGVVLAKAWRGRFQATRWTARCATASFLIAGIALTRLNITTRNTDEKLYRSALRHTSSPVMQYNLAMVLLETKRPTEALPYLQALDARDPQDANLGRALAAALWDAGHKSEARTTLNALAHQFPDDPLTSQMQQQLRKKS